MFVDESGQYFYSTSVDGSQQQMVVVSSDADGTDAEGATADGSIMLHTEDDALHTVSHHFFFYFYFYFFYTPPVRNKVTGF